MTGDVFSKARKVAEGVEENRKAKEAKREEGKARAETEKQRAAQASAAVSALDEKLDKVFNEFARKVTEGGFKKFQYQREDDVDYVFEADRKARGKVVGYEFSAPHVKSLEINLFVRKEDSVDTVSCGIVNYQAVEDEEWPVDVIEGTRDVYRESNSADPDYRVDIKVGEERVKQHCIAEVVSTPAASGPVRKALAAWFESVAAKNEEFSHLLATGKVGAKDLKVDLPRVKTETSHLPRAVIKSEPVW